MTTDRKIKVLQLQPNYHENSHGYSDLAEQIIVAFPKDRYEITTAFLQGRPASDAEGSRADKAVYFDLTHNALRGWRLRLRWMLYRFLKNERFDVVICNRYKPVSLLMQLNRWLHIPVCIGISHGFGEYAPRLRRMSAKLLIDGHWRFVGVSPAVRDYLLAQNCGFTDRNTVAITNAIDLDAADREQLSRNEARLTLGLPESACVVGAAGRLVKVKGHIHLIRAFAQVCAKHPSALLAIIGDGKEGAALEREIAHLGLTDRVRLQGFVPGAKKYIKAFDIWTMPSLSEGLGLALLEGMSGGLPVIASDIPAMAPLIHAAGGLAVPPADVAALAQALDAYLSLTSAERQEKGMVAHAYVRRNHSIDGYRAAYLALIENALSPHHSDTRTVSSE
ncbi:MAG: glycosyltransferase [Propionivibrio sp.]